MEKYYSLRANEYDDIYLKPERQNDIIKSKKILKKFFLDKKVLDVACGTGFWTETISETAKEISGTDINKEVLDIAKSKKYDCKIEFIRDDAYQLKKITKKFDSLFSGFWFSHIPKSRIEDFINVIYDKLENNSMIVFMDNNFVKGSSTPISRYDNEGNTYQNRILKNGSSHEVLKNFYNKNELSECFSKYGNDLEIIELTYYWILKFVKK